jgi:hypothetical protein
MVQGHAPTQKSKSIVSEMISERVETNLIHAPTAMTAVKNKLEITHYMRFDRAH